MGKTFSTGLLTNGLWQDSSNNIGIGAAANASFKLQVTGATNLTGALSGTSATFTAAANPLILKSTAATTMYTEYYYNTSTLSGYIGNGSGILTGANNSDFIVRSEADLVLATGNNRRMTIASSTGAVTLNGTTGDRLTLYNSGNNGGTNGLLIDSDIYPSVFFNNRVGTIGTGKIVYNTYATGYGAGSLAGALLMQGTGALQFSTGGDNVRMTITSGGEVCIGTTSATGASLTVFKTAVGGTGAEIRCTAGSGNPIVLYNRMSVAGTTSNYILAGQDSSADRIYIYGNGNIVNTNNSYGTLSDISLKENIIDATPKLNDLLQLKVRNFNLIGDKTKQIGFIAQEFEEVFPNMVDIDGKSGNKMIKTSVLIPMLVKAIQEQQAQIEELSNKIVALESK
jgi:hypothetical protein